MKRSHVKLPRRSMIARAGTVVAAVALGSCLSAGVAFGGVAETVTADSIPAGTALAGGLYSDYEGSSSALAAEMPTAFDLRHYGGTVSYDASAKKSVITDGVNYVAPVKNQSPFNDCWSFAATAASETSMITSLDKDDDGEMNGSIDYAKAASGEAGALAQAASDLSERHLAYFAFSHPSTYGMYASQAGEGKYLIGNNSSATDIIDDGGMTFLAASIYSSGIGPVPESVAPYINNEGWLQVKTPAKDVNGNWIYKYFLTLKQADDYIEQAWTPEMYTLWGYVKGDIMPSIAKRGTWSVDEDKTYQVLAELENSNIVAIAKDQQTGSMTASTIAQMKSELLAGRPLAITFVADQSTPGDTIKADHAYMNVDTWAQYTYEAVQLNHAVTIVGYDDDYDASNFTHTVYKQNEAGEWVVDEDRTAQTTPTGNGAWIVRNSWGSIDTDDETQYANWGINGSGYFYLSYYDKSIHDSESYEYDLSEEARARSSYVSYQYDLANVSNYIGLDAGVSKAVMCNVFDGPGEGSESVSIRDVGCLTGAADDTATVSVYVMDEAADATAYIDSHEPDTTQTESFAEGGYHRVHLDSSVLVNPGQKFAVTLSTQRANGNYELALSYGFAEAYTSAVNDAYAPIGQVNFTDFHVAVVNRGESYSKSGDAPWSDLADDAPVIDASFIQSFTVQQKSQIPYLKLKMEAQTDSIKKTRYEQVINKLSALSFNSAISIDNFGIKAYGDVVALEAEVSTEPVDCGDRAEFYCETSGAMGNDVSYRWQYSSNNGKTWKNCKLTGAQTDTYAVAATARRANYQYRCVATATDGRTVTSDAIAYNFTVKAVGSTEPVSLGKKAHFACEVTGAGDCLVTYQWYYTRNGGLTSKKSTLPGAKTALLSVKATEARVEAGQQYYCVATIDNCWTRETDLVSFDVQ